MILVVTWSDEARQNYFSILEYLQKRWTKKEIEAFNNKLEKTILNIAQFPNMYPHSEFLGYKRAVITKQTSLVYNVKATEIEIIALWDNRKE
ncbi:MAG: type II toxin-antitoxin system RelE/ParE family toxin [Opitutaceae bacterium]|nr:type II toxin-antitoxin system RelE/ParE family toxin [Cytophagales bacterium]